MSSQTSVASDASRKPRPSSAVVKQLFKARLPEQKKARLADFETRIRTYQGEDPLAEWVKLVVWVDKFCLDEEGREDILCALLMECCQKFYVDGRESKKYFDDPRFVGLWSKWAALVERSSEKFGFMFDHGIGVKRAELYLNWAATYEAAGETEQAKKVLAKGIAMCADSADSVAKLQSHRNMVEKISPETDVPQQFPLSQQAFIEKAGGDAPAKAGLTLSQPMPDISPSTLTPPSMCETNSSLYRTARDTMRTSDVLQLSRKLARTPFASDQSVHDRTRKSASSFGDSAYGASIHERTENRQSFSIKPSRRPRDSLSMKRYDKLHSGRTEISVPHVTPSDVDSLFIRSNPDSDEDENGQAREDDVNDWGNLNYDEFVVGNLVPLTAASESAPGPEKGGLFAWDHGRFPSGSEEFSFEEGLATVHRQKREIEYRSREADQKLENAFQARLGEKCKKMEEDMKRALINAETEKRLLEAQISMLENHRRQADLRVTRYEDKLKDVETQLRVALSKIKVSEESLRHAEQSCWAAQQILRDFAASLAASSKDMKNDEIPLVDIIITLIRDLQAGVEGLTPEKIGHEIYEVMQIFWKAVEQLSFATEDRKIRNTVAPGTRRRSSIARNNETGNSCYMAETMDFDSKENGVRSITHSASISHPRSTSEHSNPVIKAMWNQTLNQTNREHSRFPADGTSMVVTHETVKTVTVVAKTNGTPEVDAGGKSPIRQALTTKKSARKPETSALEDPENLPARGRLPETNEDFMIFTDTSHVAPYLPVVPGKDGEAGEEPDEDSENTPPPDALQPQQSPRRTNGVLNDSLEHPGIDPEKLAEEDFIEVDESEEEPEAPNDILPLVAVEPLDVPDGNAPRLDALPLRPSINFVDINSEFNSSFTSRKSFGPTDQTLPFVSEADFFKHIDPAKHMASTPLVTTQTEKAAASRSRAQARPSYIPPPLSPINEGSREKSGASTSSSGLSTWAKSKKSIGTVYSPLKENDELVVVDPYAPDTLAKFKDVLQENMREDSLYKVVTEPAPKEIILCKTQLIFQDQRYVIEEFLAKGAFASVYSIRHRTDSSLYAAVKIQETDGGWWNYHMHSEAVRRVQTLPDSDVLNALLMPVLEFHVLADSSTLTFLPLYEEENLTKCILAWQRSVEKIIPEAFSLKIALDLLRAGEALHAVNLIHGDVKVDNIMMQNLKVFHAAKTPVEFLALPAIILTDFNCGIDLTLFDGLVTFTGLKAGKSTAGSEILSQGTWSFQIDYYGILDVLHWMLFGEALKLVFKDNAWFISKAFKKTWSPVWSDAFSKLLSGEVQDLATLRNQFEIAALEKLSTLDLLKFGREIRMKTFIARKGSGTR